MGFNHDAFDDLVRRKRRNKCRSGLLCDQVTYRNAPPPPTTYEPPPNPFEGVTVPEYNPPKRLNPHVYNQMLKELKTKREAIVADEDRLTKLVEAGSTQGLGAHLENARTLIEEFDEKRDHFLRKELLRSLPPEHLRQLYTRVALSVERQGIAHPENHPVTTAYLNRAGSTPIVEALTEEYQIDPRALIKDILDRPDRYPEIRTSDQGAFDTIRKFVERQ